MILQKNGRAAGNRISPCPPVGSANHVVRSPSVPHIFLPID